MRMNKCAYLFAAALVASTVGMTSCSNEEVAGIEQGVENKVTLSMSVANRATRATADKVNMGSTMQTISNVTVVPMIGKSCLNPIIMGNLSTFDQQDGKAGIISKTTTLNSNVNGFKVYGNIDAVDGGKAFNENKTFTGFNISVSGEQTLGDNKTVFNPHGLYYYGYAGDGTNKITISTTNNDGTNTSQLEIGTAIGKDAQYVKLSDVNYAVGVLATAVFNADGKTPYIDNNNDGSADVAVSGDNVEFKGVIIDKQSKTLDQDFKQVGTGDVALVSIYDNELNTTSNGGFDGKTFQTDGNIGTSNKNKANIYTIVAATGDKKNVGEIITGNLVFTLKKGNALVLKNGTKIEATDADKDFYLAFSLSPSEEENKAVFMKDYSTFFNAKVKNWGLASDKPIEVTDVTLAVEVNIEWQEGIIYDVEI